LAATAAAHADPVRLPDGRSLDLICTGAGGPTVILEAGLGLPMETWQRVQSKLAATQRVCAYSRAGYPGSDEGPMPRDARHAAQDLDALLKAARLPGPYVLVGHSLGADVVRVYAAAHARDVKALVLVDPAIQGEARRIGAVSPETARVNALNEQISRRCIGAVAREAIWTATDPAFEVCGPPPPPDSRLADPAMARAVLSELDNVDASAAQAAAAGRADFPIVVLTADRTRRPPPAATREEMAAAVALLAREHAAIAATSTRGRQQIVADTTHLIQLDQPDAVVAAVREVSN